MKYYLLLLSVFITPLWAAEKENCGDLSAMTARYKAAIGDEYYASDFDDEWYRSHFAVATPKLETDKGPPNAIERLKDILFEEIPYLYIYHESGEDVTPYLYDIYDASYVWDDYPDSDSYNKLRQEMLKDFTQIWVIQIYVESEERHIPISSVSTIYLLGQTSCGHWAGLRTQALFD